jgi:hypothetical protein
MSSPIKIAAVAGLAALMIASYLGYSDQPAAPGAPPRRSVGFFEGIQFSRQPVEPRPALAPITPVAPMTQRIEPIAPPISSSPGPSASERSEIQ